MLCFLAALLYLDSYKLVSMRAVIAIVACGLAVAGVCYFVNGYLIGIAGIDVTAYSHYVSPVIEELGKALVIVILIRAHRIGFLVDAAIFGFAVGTGFAIVENIYYQHLIPDAGLGIWIVRGFGTAIMHGGATAIFAMMGLAMLEQGHRSAFVAFLPGFALAVALHSAFNHMYLSPRLSTLAVTRGASAVALLGVPSERTSGCGLARPGFRRGHADAGIDQFGTFSGFPGRQVP